MNTASEGCRDADSAQDGVRSSGAKSAHEDAQPVEQSLDPRVQQAEAPVSRPPQCAVSLVAVERNPVGKHLGCYNWLRLDLRHAGARAYALSRLPSFGTFFAESLVTLDTLGPLSSGPDDENFGDAPATAAPPARAQQVPTFDLRGLAARSDTAHSLRWGGVLKRSIDAGQDRAIIEALAQRFAVGDNVIRRLWREPPKALGIPPAWHLVQILRRLNELPERGWPASDPEWRDLIARAVPAEAA